MSWFFLALGVKIDHYWLKTPEVRSPEYSVRTSGLSSHAAWSGCGAATDNCFFLRATHIFRTNYGTGLEK